MEGGAAWRPDPRLAAVAALLVAALVHVLSTDPLYECSVSGGCIAEKEMLPLGQPCLDLHGNPRANGDSWRSVDSTCSINICHHGSTRNYTVRYKCKDIDARENPDKDNCYTVQDVTLAYPKCCPQLFCPNRTATNITVPSCIDRATNFSCFLWKKWGGCSPGSNYFNFTHTYCQQSCSFC